VESIGKERGKPKAVNKIVSLAVDAYDKERNGKIWIANADADETCDEVISLLNEKLDNFVFEKYDIGCVISTHAGAGVVGIIFDRKGE
ncbi:MAG: DegV family protein, partial [Clostridia bacterium]|nr:DegV family protein [Clostridia bacterium]